MRACASAVTKVTGGLTGVFPQAPSPLQEFSVVYTDRALNHMSEPFKKVMLDMDELLCDIYGADTAVIIPGSGTYGMEAVARQFATGKKAMVLRNGYFSWRWTDIFDTGDIPSESVVVQARPCNVVKGKQQFAPPPIEEMEERIRAEKPAVFFTPQVETSTGILLPDEYIARLAAAVHEVGGIFVLDAIASGTVWIDMKKNGIDALITAPQKGWSGPACAAIVMLSERGVEATRATPGTSLACNLGKWLSVMDSYKSGGFAYHTTMPTDALVVARDAMMVTRDFGFDRAKQAAFELGGLVRGVLQGDRGLVSVAAPGFESPGVVVVHTDDTAVLSKFLSAGTQIAAGVPFKLGESEDTKTFRIGLFGIDKLADPTATVKHFERALDVAVPPAIAAPAAAAA